MAPVGSVRAQPSRPGPQALRQPARGRRRHGLQMARDVYTRRQEGVQHLGGALAPDHRQRPGDKGMYFDPAEDKVYRHPTFYELPTKWGTCEPPAMTPHPAAEKRTRPSCSTCCTWPTTPDPGPAQCRVVRPRPGAGRRHCAGQHQPRPDRPGAPAVPVRGRAPAMRAPRGDLAARSTPKTRWPTFAMRKTFATTRCWSCRTRPAGRHRRRGERDYATTIVRNFLYSALMVLRVGTPATVADAHLAAIAAKSAEGSALPPAPLARLAGAPGRRHRESHRRAQAAVDHLLPFTEEFW
jgi:phenylacetate-CoA oxygenase PaaH subunit